MPEARLVITAVTAEGLSQGEAARRYGVSQGWISKLMARYRAEGEAASGPRSRRPRTSPNAIAPGTAELIVTLRKELAGQGLDAGPQTIAWHLEHRHRVKVPPAAVSRTLARRGLVVPDPAKQPESSCLRFAAGQPSECWQSDFTHYPLAGGTDTEILTWLDGHSRHVLSLTAHARAGGPAVLAAFRAAVAVHGPRPLP
jgi:transposase